LSNLFLSITATRPIKVTETAPSDSESIRKAKKELESQKTGRVTTVAVVMKIFKKTKGSLRSATQRSSHLALNAKDLASKKTKLKLKSAKVRPVRAINSLTAIRVLAGTKNSRPVGFYSRNSTKSTLNHKHNNPQHYHHGGAVCPSYGVGSMDPPDRTRVTSSEGVGRGGW